MEDICVHLAATDIFATIGTSGVVYPTATFVDEAHLPGTHTGRLSLHTSATASRFAKCRSDPAREAMPAWMAELLT